MIYNPSEKQSRVSKLKRKELIFSFVMLESWLLLMLWPRWVQDGEDEKVEQKSWLWNSSFRNWLLFSPRFFISIHLDRSRMDSKSNFNLTILVISYSSLDWKNFWKTVQELVDILLVLSTFLQLVWVFKKIIVILDRDLVLRRSIKEMIRSRLLIIFPLSFPFDLASCSASFRRFHNLRLHFQRSSQS